MCRFGWQSDGRVGNIEFGFRLSLDRRHLEPDPTEQAALAEIRNLRRQGHTLRGIAATLNSRGLFVTRPKYAQRSGKSPGYVYGDGFNSAPDLRIH
jgi:hypothetical protein